VGKCGTTTQDTEESIIRRMSFACWITKATDTHLESVILIVFPLQKSVHEYASMFRLYLHCLSFCYCRGRSHILRNLSLGTPVTDARLKCNAVLRTSPLCSKLLILIPESNEADKAVITICHYYKLHSLIILKLHSFFCPLIYRVFFLCVSR
jgi:hypothetical protein